MARREWKWTKHQLDKLNKVQEILIELESYKPLTLRQIYYQLVSREYIENKVSEYGMLSNLLKWARIEGYISWGDVEDRVRHFHDLRGWSNAKAFEKAHYQAFLTGYNRNLLQSQDKYIEIWVEKDAVSSIFTRVSQKYTVPVVVCRGFNSVSFLNEYRERLNYYPGKHAVLLYFGDFDPSGVEMLNSAKITLEEEMKVENIEFKRVALQKEDIFRYKLPHDPRAIKKTDSRTKKHVAKYGELAVELDALAPQIMEEKVKTALESELDMTAFYHEIDKEKTELDRLSEIKAQVREFLQAV